MKKIFYVLVSSAYTLEDLLQDAARFTPYKTLQDLIDAEPQLEAGDKIFFVEQLTSILEVKVNV